MPRPGTPLHTHWSQPECSAPSGLALLTSVARALPATPAGNLSALPPRRCLSWGLCSASSCPLPFLLGNRRGTRRGEVDVRGKSARQGESAQREAAEFVCGQTDWEGWVQMQQADGQAGLQEKRLWAERRFAPPHPAEFSLLFHSVCFPQCPYPGQVHTT